MAKNRDTNEQYFAPLRRLGLAVLLLLLAGIFLIWRIDSPRVERFRMAVIDRVVPSMDWAMTPVTASIEMLHDLQSYARLVEQNQQLRNELQQMKAWKEAALQLEQENARLLDLNNMRLDPQLTKISGEVMADSGSPFRQSVLLNVGARDGIVDGWATMDGIGLVGRIAGVGARTSRVILLTDTNSRVPVTVQPSGQRAMIVGDNTAAPPLEFVENLDLVRPGDRVVSSGDGGVFPAGLLVGQVAQDRNGRMRVRLAADYERLKFLKVLRSQPAEAIASTGDIVSPLAPEGPMPLPEGATPATAAPAEGEPAPEARQ
ncbi:rod shape-determining protein MreC [Donghicola tyrosinivorans]|uniref:Cell shape-determining protein MreC n=1 Tax=Donghicola tyrosinivorans TaxID=1652492 RepID=A0A2T0WXW1_9RHOB|nr:rod shape-determining protein MreC [Donghicola tyrosinivorans]PRY91485.1 rod shape-determining protein MreC [Donghicola tyrosinivorans]